MNTLAQNKPAPAPSLMARQGRAAFMAMLGISLVVMLSALDQTVVGTAMPRIVAELQGVQYYSWIGSVYLLTSVITLPLTGRMGDMYGRKPFMLMAIIIFTVASALCGLVQNMPQLILARALQGVGGGMVMAVAFASVNDLFPDVLTRIRWMSMTTTMVGGACAFGPLLGGLLTEHFGWRSVFYVNLPVGLTALWVVSHYLPRFPGHRQTGENIAWLDALLLAAALSACLLILDDGAALGYGSLKFLLLVASGLICASVFAWRLPRVSSPIIPPRMLKLGAVRSVGFLSFLTGAVQFMLMFYMPLLLQSGFGRSPKLAGLLITPLAFGLPLGSLLNSRLLPKVRWGHQFVMLASLLLAGGCSALILLRPASPDWLILSVLGVCGLSFGFIFPNLNTQMQCSVATDDVGAGSALNNTLRTFGGMLSASLTLVIVNWRYANEVNQALATMGEAGRQALPWLGNLQILSSSSDQTALQHAIAGTPASMASLLETAQHALLSGVHLAFAGAALLLLAGALLAQRLPPLPLRHTEQETPPDLL